MTSPLRALAALSGLLLAVAIAAPLAAQSRIPAPEGWISAAPTKGQLAAIKHPATLGRAEVARLTVSKDDLPSWRADLIDRLQKAGMTLKGKPVRIDVGGVPALKTTLVQQKLDRPFDIVFIEVHTGTALLHVSAVLRPDDDNSLESLEEGVIAFGAAALAAQK